MSAASKDVISSRCWCQQQVRIVSVEGKDGVRSRCWCSSVRRDRAVRALELWTSRLEGVAEVPRVAAAAVAATVVAVDPVVAVATVSTIATVSSSVVSTSACFPFVALPLFFPLFAPVVAHASLISLLLPS